jgi:hypothetical protein
MSRLIMNDGSQLTVNYDRARTVWSMLNGHLKPKTDKQVRFLNAVKDVQFDSDRPDTARRPIMDIKRHSSDDPAVRSIIEDPTIKGREKMAQVMNTIRLRKRIDIPVTEGQRSAQHDIKNAWIADGFTRDQRRRYMGVRYCVNCHVAQSTAITTSPDNSPVLRRSDLRMVIGDIIGYCNRSEL